MSAGDAYENIYLDKVLGSGTPVTVYVALFTVTPTDVDGSGTEVTGGAYARVAVTNSVVNWPAATGGQKKNGTAILFPEATVSWGTVSHFAIMSAATGGNIIHRGALGTPTAIGVGVAPVFNANAIVITAD